MINYYLVTVVINKMRVDVLFKLFDIFYLFINFIYFASKFGFRISQELPFNQKVFISISV